MTKKEMIKKIACETEKAWSNYSGNIEMFGRDNETTKLFYYRWLALDGLCEELGIDVLGE